MTGPEHYFEAERLAASADIAIGQYEEHGYEDKRDVAALLMAEAQVHATLALAAATAMGSADLPSGDWDDWRFIASAGHAGRIPGSEREVTP